MTIDDYYHRASDAGTEHLAHRPDGPALCGYAFGGRGELVLDADGGVAESDLCGTCAAQAR